jgi:hypothetical protein
VGNGAQVWLPQRELDGNRPPIGPTVTRVAFLVGEGSKESRTAILEVQGRVWRKIKERKAGCI